MRDHPFYRYMVGVLDGSISAPKYVKKQCARVKRIADGDDPEYCIDEEKLKLVGALLKLMIMPKGVKVGKTVYEALSGFQWLFIVAIICTVHRSNRKKRKYETAILEICRKNGKTFLIAVIFILLFLLEPKFSKFYSVAPDGSLSREVKEALSEIISASPVLYGNPETGIQRKFRILRDFILCELTSSKLIPLNYSSSRLDGRLPNAFLADEVGALPNSYALEAMRSGQLTILNKLGCIISTKYPTSHNPFEDEVEYAKKVLDDVVDDETVFALLYEPDDTENWMTDDEILRHSNPLALDEPTIWEDLLQKRKAAIEMESKRENFVTKHCNIIYQGIGTETYIPVSDVQKCRTEFIDWVGKTVYIGVDLSMSRDNTAVALAANDNGTILADVIAFVPEGRIDEKNHLERIDYRRFIDECKCIACGDRTVDYGVIEEFVFKIEEQYGVKVAGIAFDRWNAMSSAQKWDRKYNTVEVKQHSSVLHPATKLLEEKILDGKFAYTQNTLLEINFENARCRYDTNLNRYVDKKRSSGKVDMVVALINAVYLLNECEVINADPGWVIQY